MRYFPTGLQLLAIALVSLAATLLLFRFTEILYIPIFIYNISYGCILPADGLPAVPSFLRPGSRFGSFFFFLGLTGIGWLLVFMANIVLMRIWPIPKMRIDELDA